MSIWKRPEIAAHMRATTAATPPQMRVNACKQCGSPLDRSRPWQEFCRDQCRYQWNNERRRTEIKSPPLVAAGSGDGKESTSGDRKRTPSSPIRQHTKLHAVLAELARGRSLNRFEAYRDLHDSVLNSTIPEIEQRGIVVSRREEVVPGSRGSNVRCSRYWLEPAEAEKAATLLGWRVAE